jgi:hypothetical protein
MKEGEKMLDKKQRRPQSRQQRIISAGISGGLLGAIGGALIGASFGGSSGVLPGAVTGALVIGLAEAITDAHRKPAQLKPLVHRILVATFIGAAFGALLGLVFSWMSLIVMGLIIGLLSGAFGLRLKSLGIGFVVGIGLGVAAEIYFPSLNPAILGGLIVFFYRVLSALIFRGQEVVQFNAERVPASEIRYVVPFEANSKYVGADYFVELAREQDGSFKRNLPDIGIVEAMENMRGPNFDPSKVDPLIREFYEHTSRFTLSIVPVWKNRIKPLFWLFKRTIAQPMGQANLPFNSEEAQSGVVSYIDAIDFDCDDIVNLRGWVRTFKETGEAIYVGIYTTFQHEGVGYVSVGFPLPDANFTATLLPFNYGRSNFLLKSRDTGYPYPGHYLTAKEDGNLTVMKLPTFDEEIEVYVAEGQLKTDHRFYLAGLNFLTLYYTMERIEEGS